MKKVLSLYTREMIRPIIYKCVNKCAIALVIVLLWDRYISRGALSAVRDGGFAAGLGFFALAFVYEHIVTFDELDDEQQLACVLASNLFSGLVFLIPALIAAAAAGMGG